MPTAVAVADALGDPATVFLASSAGFADALAAGPAAAKMQGVILLTDGTRLPPETAAYLQAHPGTTYAVGGGAVRADRSASALWGRIGSPRWSSPAFFPGPSGLASEVVARTGFRLRPNSGMWVVLFFFPPVPGRWVSPFAGPVRA